MKIIQFASKILYLELPTLGLSVLPAWYKKAKARKHGESFPLDLDGRATATFKACMPLLDSFTSGYFFTLPQDLQVRQLNGVAQINWSGENEPIKIRDGTHTSPDSVPAGYSGKAWVWINNVITKLPSGYSLIVCHPMNRYDLPFITMSSIVDADEIMHEGKIPFYLKEGFEGIIKKGTPIFQVIPFKREHWKSEKNDSLIGQAEKNRYNVRAQLEGWYKKNIWKKKVFNNGIVKL